MADFVNNALAAFALDIGDRVTRATEQVAGQNGALAAVLTYLAQEPGIGVEQLRGALGLSQPATVRLINQLTNQGLVTRSAHGSDARRVRLQLTARGHTRVRAILAARRQAVDPYVEPLDAAEQATLVDLISRVYRRQKLDANDIERTCRLCDTQTCRPPDCPVALAVDH